MREARLRGRFEAGQRIGEVVEAASHRILAQCYRLYCSPPLGAFVRTESVQYPLSPFANGRQREIEREAEGETSHIYAVVYGISTESLDPGRPVIARGEYENSEEDVYRSNPQLERLLCTRFEALIVGHSDGDTCNQRLPALPPRIHSFVYLCTPEEVGQFTRSMDFLSLLANSVPSGQGITDEVIVACLRQASAHLETPRGFLVGAGKALAVQLAGDTPRLNSILRRLSP